LKSAFEIFWTFWTFWIFQFFPQFRNSGNSEYFVGNSENANNYCEYFFVNIFRKIQKVKK
jgi:hypothetical protein